MAREGGRDLLATYKAKRDFAKTPEPRAKVKRASGKHHSRPPIPPAKVSSRPAHSQGGILGEPWRRRTWSWSGKSSRPRPIGTRSARCCIPTPGSIRAASRTGGVYEGREACGRFFERWFGTWDEIRLTPERFIEDGDRVLALMTIEGRGKGSGVPVVIRSADLWTIRDGKIVSLVGYPDRAEALEDVELRE